MKKKYRRLSLSKVTLYPLVLSPMETAWVAGGAYRIVISEVTQSNCQGLCQSLNIGVCQVLTEDNCGPHFEVEYRVR